MAVIQNLFFSNRLAIYLVHDMCLYMKIVAIMRFFLHIFFFIMQRLTDFSNVVSTLTLKPAKHTLDGT